MSNSFWRILAFLSVLVLAACSSAEPTRSGGLPAEVADLVTGSGQFATDERVLDAATAKLERDCTGDRGPLAPRPPLHLLPGGVTDPRDEVAKRAIHGYGVLDAVPLAGHTSESAEAEPKKESQYPSLTRQGTAESFGTLKLRDGSSFSYEVTGCLADARRKLTGGDLLSWAQMEYETQSLDFLVEQKTLDDPKYSLVMGSWADCMVSRGYNYLTPDQAIADFKRVAAAGQVSVAVRAKEKAVAVADSMCAYEREIPTRVMALMRQHVNDLPRQDQDHLIQLAHFRSDVLARARAVTR